MKTLILFLASISFVWSAVAAEEKLLLNCEKKDFFYWGEPLRVKLFEYEGQLVLRYNYQSGIASIGVKEVGPREYSGKTDFVSAVLKPSARGYYTFQAKDSYDGLLGIGPTQVNCAQP